MSLVSVELPEKFIFSTVIPVRISDVNYGNHLGNDALLSMMHEARVRFLQNLGLSEMDIGGVAIIMRDVAIVYKSEARYGDELLFEIAVGHFTSSSFDIFYKVTNRSTGKALAEAKTGIVCYDYGEKKVKAVPQSFRQKLE